MTRKAFAFDYWQQPAGAGVSSSSRDRILHRYFGRILDVWAGINLSIRAKILLSLCVVILVMGSANAVLMLQMMNYSNRYNAIIENITTANKINDIKLTIDAEMWDIVSGKIQFRQGKHYDVINQVNADLQRMMENTDSHEARMSLEVIRRTVQTLTEQIDRMGAQIQHNSTSEENEAALEKIRFVSGVVEGTVQDYLLLEVRRTEGQYAEMRDGFTRFELINIILMAGAIAFSVIAAWGSARSIYIPIEKLHNVTRTITKNDLQALVTKDNADEIAELGLSFNIMIGKIRELLESKMKEQEELKKAELRALQAQINPHFLYNTLDTIIWMAEANKSDQVIEIVSALSNFFRISLSKGRDWITVGEEIEQTRSYLTIQKMRYRDIMDYKIQVDEQVVNNTVLKLSLQPLVENALYHGIKNKRQGGTIIVRATQKNEDQVLLEVEDNGIGFTPEKLAQVQAQLNDDMAEIRQERGFGLDNVNKRIRLYYGKQYGLTIKSEYTVGTCVSLVIPTQKDDTSRLSPCAQIKLPGPIGS
jgi:two-component system, sensor histidine kinase YesM